MADKTKQDLKREKSIRIITLSNAAIEMLESLNEDVKLWASDVEITTEEQTRHQMHQNETIANLKFLIEYLENKQRRS